MFNLDEQLHQWRQRFAALDVMRGRDLDELEQHVRDSIDALASLGLSTEEAFMVATHRVGAPGAVCREFAKVNGDRVWARRVVWMIAGVLAYTVGGLLIAVMASLGQLVVMFSGGSGTTVGAAAVGITSLAWLALGAVIYLFRGADVRSWRVGRLSTGAIVLSVAVAVAAGMALQVVSQTVLARFTPVRELTDAMSISNAAALMWTVLMPVALLITMLLIRRQQRVNEI
jgi:hypothetical protein